MVKSRCLDHPKLLAEAKAQAKAEGLTEENASSDSDSEAEENPSDDRPLLCPPDFLFHRR